MTLSPEVEVTRAVVLHETSTAITKLRESQNLAPRRPHSRGAAKRIQDDPRDPQRVFRPSGRKPCLRAQSRTKPK
jgi:hypothetical protein